MNLRCPKKYVETANPRDTRVTIVLIASSSEYSRCGSVQAIRIPLTVLFTSSTLRLSGIASKRLGSIKSKSHPAPALSPAISGGSLLAFPKETKERRTIIMTREGRSERIGQTYEK